MAYSNILPSIAWSRGAHQAVIVCSARQATGQNFYWSHAMNLIQQLEQEEIARLGKTVPEFAPGDTVVVTGRFATPRSARSAARAVSR